MNSFEIEYVDYGKRTWFYALAFDGGKNEFEKFDDTFAHDFRFIGQLDTIMDRINVCLDEGLNQWYVKDQMGSDDTVAAIRPDAEGRWFDEKTGEQQFPDQLRLYGLRFTNRTFIIGPGAIKRGIVRRTQDDPHLNRICVCLRGIDGRLSQAIKEKELIVLPSGQLRGKLQYDFDFVL